MKIPANEVCRSCGWLIELTRSASALNADTVTGTVCAFSLTRRAVTTISPMPESVGVSVAGGTDGMFPPTEPVGAPVSSRAEGRRGEGLVHTGEVGWAD